MHYQRSSGLSVLLETDDDENSSGSNGHSAREAMEYDDGEQEPTAMTRLTVPEFAPGPPRTSARMGRRFTLNPLIFAKEEREARRQSLAQLKLSYYPRHALRKFYQLIPKL